MVVGSTLNEKVGATGSGSLGAVTVMVPVPVIVCCATTPAATTDAIDSMIATTARITKDRLDRFFSLLNIYPPNVFFIYMPTGTFRNFPS